ncbi:MAG TPA: ferritin-like domain-containing protein [Acidimicrobiia bacterium]|nr:ferritin-like domain-containing protein [Acidimicrobiia bacterium]
MTTRHYALPVETTQWLVEGTTRTAFNWEYDEPRDRLLTLYEKGKRKQWDAQTLIDWSLDLDIEDQGVFPDMYVPIYGSPSWEKMSRAEKDRIRHHYSAWLNSQFLHGEQGALVCAAKIVQTVPDIDSKFYAATQVMDEARHVEAYNKFLLEKLELAYPIHPQLAALLDQTIADPRWDITYLGMQVMIEGVALAAFSLIRDFTQHPLPRSLNAYVMKDEARHVAFGLLALQDAYKDITEAERREREEFVIEAGYLLRDRIVAEELWANMGLDVAECLEYVDQAEIMSFYRQALFSRVVPTVKRIGLWSDKIQEAFVEMGVLAYADSEPAEMFANDERIAEELEVAIAALHDGGDGGDGEAPAMPATRAEQVAEAIVAGEA